MAMRPFSGSELSEYIKGLYNKISTRIKRYTNDEIMGNDIELLADNCYEEFYIVPIHFSDEDIEKRDMKQVDIVKKIHDNLERKLLGLGTDTVCGEGIEFTFRYSFNGDSCLFNYRPCRSKVFPEIEIEEKEGYLKFQYKYLNNETKQSDFKSKLFTKLQHDVDEIKKGIDYANDDVEKYNGNIKNRALRELRQKKEAIENFYEISKSFEIPLKKNNFAETHIPTKRRNIAPTTKKYNNEPNYYISDAEYKDILMFIKHYCSTYESTPHTFRSLKEEDLRNLLLAGLNGVYQGIAYGEAFRKGGKTDICIQSENRAAFIAECKMWGGASQIPDALNQLDGYLTWRDCKTALILFVKNKNFGAVLDSAKKTLDNHASIRQIKEVDRNEFDCSLASKSNIGQLVKTRVFLFNLYSS